MSILLIDFNDITIEQLLSQLNPVIELGGERAELACRYDERQGGLLDMWWQMWLNGLSCQVEVVFLSQTTSRKLYGF